MTGALGVNAKAQQGTTVTHSQYRADGRLWAQSRFSENLKKVARRQISNSRKNLSRCNNAAPEGNDEILAYVHVYGLLQPRHVWIGRNREQACQVVRESLLKLKTNRDFGQKILLAPNVMVAMLKACRFYGKYYLLR